MTKEDLEEMYEDSFTASTRPSEGGYGPDVTDGIKLWKLLDPIVASYAKQQAIAFANYVMKEYTKALCSDSLMLSDEDIYAQFIEQQNKP